MDYRGVIFDFNGTLFWDSEKHLEAWREFSKRLREHAFTDNEMREYMFGRTNEDIIAYLSAKNLPKKWLKNLQKKKKGFTVKCAEKTLNTFILHPTPSNF